MKSTLAILFSSFTISFSAFAQSSYNFIYTGQPVEKITMNGYVSGTYEGTCYENEQWTTQECDYSGRRPNCRTVYHGSSTPYSCTQYGKIPGKDKQAKADVNIHIQSSLVNPLIEFKVLQKSNAEISVTPEGLLPAGTIMGIDTGSIRERSDSTLYHDVYIKLTTNLEVQKQILEKISSVKLDQANRRMVITLVGEVNVNDKIKVILKKKKGLFRSEETYFTLEGSITNLVRSGYNVQVPSEMKSKGKETQLELDLINVLGEEKLNSLQLEISQVKVLDPKFTWTGMIGKFEKELVSPVKIH